MNRREMVYQPLGQRVCTTTHEQMDEKLQRRMREIASKALLKPGESVNPDTGEIHVEQSESQLRPAAEPAGRSGVVGDDQTACLLHWCKPERGATGVRTTCGRYSCGKITTDGKVTYELWKLSPGGAWFTCLRNGLDTFEAAKTLAEQHVRTK